MASFNRVSDLGTRGVANHVDGSIFQADFSSSVPLSGFRNKIINGDFSVNQRTFVSSTTGGQYGIDRWYANMSDGTVTYSVQSFTAGDPTNPVSSVDPSNFARIAVTGQSAASAEARLIQAVEDVRTFSGQPVTVSFWAKANSGTPKIALEFVQGFGSGGSSSALTYGGQVTLSTSWARYSLTVTVPSVYNKTIGADNCLFVCFWVSAGSNFNSRTGSLGIQNTTIDFWGVQAELGSQMTPFEQRPQGVELSLCQRYYWAESFSGSGNNFIDGYQIYGGYMTTFFPFPQTMRKIPSLFQYGIGGFSAIINWGITALTPSYGHIYAAVYPSGRAYYYLNSLQASAEY